MKKFDINLVLVEDIHTTYYSYDWSEIPVVGDKLSLSAKEIFIVKERLLPTISESNRIILIGYII